MVWGHYPPIVESQLSRLNGLENLLPWLRQTPSITTYRINPLKTSREKFKSYLQTHLQQTFQCPPEVFTLNDVPEVVCIGPVEKAQPPCSQQKEIIVDSCCGAAVLRGAHIYSIGVMAMESGSKVGDKVNVFCDLEGKCKKGLNVTYNSVLKLYMGQGKIAMQRYQIFRPEGPAPGIAVEMINTTSGVPSIGNLSSSDALLQNLPSIVCARTLDPQPNEIVLDMCAAPGNKTTHLAELMNDRGTIVALDKTDSKICLVLNKIKTNGLGSIKAYAYDSTQAYANELQENTSDIRPPFIAETFDRILLDAPCSALGNRPLLSIKISPKMLESYPKVQKKLFANAVPLLKRGGVLVYSTCTVSVAENEEIVAWALQKYPELLLVRSETPYSGPGWSCESLRELDRIKLQRFGPNQISEIDTVGFFIAKFQKVT